MGLLSNIFSGGAEKLVSSVGGVLDNLITSKEEKETLKLELTKEINRNIEALQADATKQLELELKDMADARGREVQIANSEHAPLINKIITPVLSLLILGSCFLMWYIIMFKDIPKEKETLVAGIVGSLTTISMGVVGYYFGSSAGSAAKQKQLDTIMNK